MKTGRRRELPCSFSGTRRAKPDKRSRANAGFTCSPVKSSANVYGLAAARRAARSGRAFAAPYSRMTPMSAIFRSGVM